MRIGTALLFGWAVAALASCGDDGGNGTGSLEITGSYDFEVTTGARLFTVVTGCPLDMPPAYDSIGTVEDGQVHDLVEGIEPGEWCVQTYIDMIPDDSLMPVQGTDATMVLEAGAQSLPVTIEAGRTTTIEVEFELSGQDTDTDTGTGAEEPGPDDVWLRVTIECPTCTSDAAVIFYGYAGDTMQPGPPSIYNTTGDGVSFPIVLELKETGAMSVGPFVAGQHIMAAYQDLDGSGMAPDPGEPISEPVVRVLEAGVWNEIDLLLE